MGLPAVKGAILEEVVLHLLEMVGYRVVKTGEEGTRKRASGLEVEGRGEWHQIDALAALDHTSPFMYPLRLLLEAKCYAGSRPIGIDVVRNAVGVLKDISENYFTHSSPGRSGRPLKLQRFNYHSAIFSTSGYTKGAQRYAIAHQIFLIQYDGVYLFQEISQGLRDLSAEHFERGAVEGKGAPRRVRGCVRRILADDRREGQSPFSPEGEEFFNERIVRPLKSIGGSYFGMLQGRWPMHLLSKEPLPASLFAERDVLPCKVYGRENTHWSFVPSELPEGDPNWFRLDFDLPGEIAELVKNARGNRETIAGTKKEYFSFISVSGLIGGIRRHVRLELDEEWLEEHLRRARRSRNYFEET